VTTQIVVIAASAVVAVAVMLAAARWLIDRPEKRRSRVGNGRAA
jgi:predicted tellurium resistance membrane protein TerC